MIAILLLVIFGLLLAAAGAGTRSTRPSSGAMDYVRMSPAERMRKAEMEYMDDFTKQMADEAEAEVIRLTNLAEAAQDDECLFDRYLPLIGELETALAHYDHHIQTRTNYLSLAVGSPY